MAARRKPVEIRRLDQRVPIPAHDLPVMFVRADEYDVWRVLPVIHLPRRSGFRQNCSGPGCDSFTELSSSDSRHFRFCAIPCNPRRKDVCDVFIPNQSCASRWYWTLTQRVKICQHAAKFEIQNRWSTCDSFSDCALLPPSPRSRSGRSGLFTVEGPAVRNTRGWIRSTGPTSAN